MISANIQYFWRQVRWQKVVSGAIFVSAFAAPSVQAQMPTPGDPDFYRALAAHHAPVIVQGIGSNPKADMFTRVDFDGDFNTDNSWANLDRISQIGSYVYFDVIEAKNNYFITYALYYPRDYNPICLWQFCHENDFEGIRITVDKRGDDPMGEAVLLETLAHNKLNFDGSPRRMGNQMMIVVEKQGHGIHTWNERRPDKKSITYHYAGNPFAVSGYALLPLHTLWDQREAVGRQKLWASTFDYEGDRFSLDQIPAHFGGNKWGRGKANPAWSWNPAGRNLRKGDWFFDPIQSLCQVLECPTGSDGTYVFNPYVGIGSNALN